MRLIFLRGVILLESIITWYAFSVSYVHWLIIDYFTHIAWVCMAVSYGCFNDQINDLCVSWRKSLCRIWDLPFNSHCYLLPLLSQCLPLLDEICRRSLNYIKACLYNGSSLVRAVTNYGIRCGRHNSLLGHNLLFCARLYNCMHY